MRWPKFLAKRLTSHNYNDWKYDFKPLGKAVEVTITNPEGQVLRPVLMPRNMGRNRSGWDFFNG